MVKFWKIPYTFSVCLYNLQVTPFDSGIENFLNMIFRTIKKVTVKVKLPLRKLKTVLPSLKPPVEWSIRVDIIYQNMCLCFKVPYVGWTEKSAISYFDGSL